MTPTVLAALAALLAAPLAGGMIGICAERFERVGVWTPKGRRRCGSCGARQPLRNQLLLAAAAPPPRPCVRCGAVGRADLLAPEFGAVLIAITALLGAGAAPLWASLGLGWTLLALALIDLRCFRLPDALTAPLLLAGLALSALGLLGAPLSHGLGAALGFGLLAGLAWLHRRLRGVEGLGLGDAKLAAAGGAWLGAPALPSAILIASLAGLGLALALFAREAETERWRAPTPFGPALALGVWATWLWGPLI